MVGHVQSPGGLEQLLNGRSFAETNDNHGVPVLAQIDDDFVKGFVGSVTQYGVFPSYAHVSFFGKLTERLYARLAVISWKW